jgi:hypothetical protein
VCGTVETVFTVQCKFVMRVAPKSDIRSVYLFEGDLADDIYLQFLQNELSYLLEDVLLETKCVCILFLTYIQQNGAPPHFGHAVDTHPYHRPPDQWISHGDHSMGHSDHQTSAS